MVRKFFLTLLSLIFSLVFTIWITAFNLKYFFLNPNYYKNLLEKSGIYDQLIEIIPDLTLDKQNFEFGNIPVRFTEEELLSIYSKVVTREYVQVQIEKTLDDTFYSLNQGKNLDINISVEEPKENLQKEIQLLLEKKLRELPDCSEAELQSISSSEGSEIPLCLPVGVELQTFLDTYMGNSIFGSISSEIPEVISLYGGNESDINQKIVSMSLMLRLLTHEIYYLSLIFSILLMGAIFAIAIPTSSRFRWVGWNLLNIALFPFLISILGFFIGNRFIGTLLNSYGSSLPQKIIYALSPIFESLFLQLWLLIFTESLFILIPGIVLLVVSIIYKNIERSEKERELN